MKKIFAPLCLVTAIALCSSCSDDEKETHQKTLLNIGDAKSLAVVEESIGGRLSETQPTLFKITTNGSFEEVKFINADGTDIDSQDAAPHIIVYSILNIDSTYLLLTGSFSIWNTHYASLLIRKSDGAIFDFGENDIALDRHKFGEKPLKYDASGDIYYSNGSGVNKLTISTPEQISKISYLPTGQNALFFDVDPDGNCIYKYGESMGVTNSNGTHDLRIKKLNGGIFEIKVAERDNREFWIGNDGFIYFITYTWDNGFLPAIHKIAITNNDVTIQDVWSTNSTDSYPRVGQMLRLYNEGFYTLRKNNSMVFIGPLGGWEFFENDNSVENIELPVIESGSVIVHSEQFYYIATGTDLYKVNLENHEYSKLLNSGEYEVYSMNVDSNDIIQFSGLRFSDGKKIFAEISEEGQFTILDEELDRKATVLERLD